MRPRRPATWAWWLAVGGLPLCAVVCGATPVAPTFTSPTVTPPRLVPVEPTMTLSADEQTFFIVDTTQLTFQDLRIGAGNFYAETYTDLQGQPQEGWRCGLWFYLRTDATQDRSLRVSPGQVVQIGPYAVRVIMIEEAQVQVGITVVAVK